MYRRADSVFNDDNFNTVLTGFDMLVLRAHYAPELRTGMSEAEVAARLPAILARLNPVGETIAAGPPLQLSPRSWIAVTEAAFSTQGGTVAQRAATQKMLAIALAQGWQDNRLALSYFATGRSLISYDMPAAIKAFHQADKIYRTLPGGELHAAHVDMQLAAFALAARQFGEALALTERAIPVVKRGENASLLATLLMLRAEALDAVGRKEDARAARLDSLGWARYGFGSQTEVKARMADIAALANRGHRS
jgi:tetratricopeptide (TPR) repeat protein